MRVEVHYDDGHADVYEGESLMVYAIRPEGDGTARLTLGLGGKLDAIGICNLLLLLEMQLQGSADMVDIGVELWKEQRYRLRAEAEMCREAEEGDHGREA